ncbi:MAG: metallophosphoesterase [Candidatus Thorarchaeota archaeon]|nr:MAG: metallophosphoesterase [Candidatus Thorarchaeota archaeon]
MRIGAVADVHSPKFLNEFTSSLKQCRKLDLFLLAGDIINRGSANEYHRVVAAIDRFHGAIPIIACFGNEEYNESRREIIALMEDRVTFLDESKISLSFAGSKIGIAGASVLLESSESSPERTRSPDDDIRPAFEKRALRISQHLQMLTKSSDHTVLLLLCEMVTNRKHLFGFYEKNKS